MGRKRGGELAQPGVTFDAGALIAFDRGSRAMRVLVERLVEMRTPVVVPACAVAEVWRDSSRQARLARLLSSDEVEVEPLTDQRARAVGELCGLRGSGDIADAVVALVARKYGGVVITSDPNDLRRFDPSLYIR